MSLSLRDQLLQAGFVESRKQKSPPPAKHQQGKRPQAGSQRTAPSPAAAAKAERDKELNRQRQAQRELGARLAEIRQLVEQHRLPVSPSEEYFNFVHKGRVRRIAVDAELRERIRTGSVFIVRYGKFYALVAPEIAERVRERHAESLVNLEPASDVAPASDDPYAAFKVPDDLFW